MFMRLILYPFSYLYKLIIGIRNLCFDYGILKSKRFSEPVISVGNITVGGTGKTPHVEYLIRLLSDKYKVSVLSRGYKRKTRGSVLATDNPTSKDIGDELVQIKRKFPKIDVLADAKRVRGVERLLQRKNQVVILDDAYQHRYIKPGLSILLIDFNRQINDDLLLPVGNLREPKKSRDRADIIIFTKTPANIQPIEKRLAIEHLQAFPFQQIYFSTISYGKLINVFSDSQNVSENFLKTPELYTIILVTGIANTKTIKEYLKKYTIDIKHIEFADHVSYSKHKIKQIYREFEDIKNEKKIIITTEKDAVKFREIKNIDKKIGNNMFYLPIEIKILENNSKFNKNILKYVENNTRNS